MKEGLSYFTDTHLTVAGLLIFLAAFIGILLYNWTRFDKKLQTHIEGLPFDEGVRVNPAPPVSSVNSASHSLAQGGNL